ncbi:MAG: FAD-binding protein [Lachnospiraceae bacterium]
MIRINQMKITPSIYQIEEKRDAVIKQNICKTLRIAEEQIAEYRIVKESIDARKKPDIYYTLSIDISIIDSIAEALLLKRCHDRNVSQVSPEKYRFPKYNKNQRKLEQRPIIIGSGPAGLFCAYQLALHGYRPLVLERGEEVTKRIHSVTEFWKNGILNPESNVQFGEGGAGTFSDGKLNTQVKDKCGRNREILRILVEAGAPQQILYENNPHLGTDLLVSLVQNMRRSIVEHGGEVRFESKVTRLKIEGQHVTGVIVNGTEEIDSELVILAIGHSARDTVEAFYEQGILMEAKSFAVGLRVEHKQSIINQSQYGMAQPSDLPPASYKLTAQTKNGRGVYSFCMCPGGYVVNASSEDKMLAVNGMSYHDRAGKHANSAIIVSVTPNDYGSEHPLAGIRFQRMLEHKAYELGQGKVPVQLFSDYKDGSRADLSGTMAKGADNLPAVKGQYVYADVRSILPEELNLSLIEGMEQFGKIIKGFDAEDTILSGVESRTSSPVRIHRDDSMQSAVRGLYPCGEGAGYAGGIISAAMDGMKIAEEIASKYAAFSESVRQ